VQVFLRRRALFAGAAAEDLAELLAHVEPVILGPGDFLFHEDDPPSHVFVVEEGTLEIFHERPRSGEHLHVADVGRGAVVGEIAVMRGDARTASVRALEPSRLIALPAREFVAFVRKTPSAALRLAEILAERAQPPPVSETQRRVRGNVWAVERTRELDGAFAAAVARAAWRKNGGSRPPKVLCGPGARVRLGRQHGLLFEPLAEAPRPGPGEVSVVLAERRALDAWAACFDGLVTGTEGARPWPSLPLGRHVSVVTAGPPGTHVVRLSRDRIHESAERVVRILEGRTIGIALGGGGALGLSHIGVLDVLERERIPIDVMVGTSAGAMVGGIGLVLGLEALAGEAKRMTRTRLFGLVDPSFFVSGLIEGRRILRLFHDLVGDTQIEDLPIPFAALALDLETGEERALTGGGLAEALRASISLPSVFAPFAYDGVDGRVQGGTYVDAGSVNNVPVDVTRELGGARVIGVNVINRPRGWTRSGPPWRNWSPVYRSKMVAYAEMIGFARNGERHVFTADVPILPVTHDFGFTQFYRAEELVQAGRRAAEALIPRLRALKVP
jgi:NTE family protein